jgi:membrane protein
MHLRSLLGNRVFKLLKATFDAWTQDNALRLSAALAYYSIFSIAPLLIIAVSVAGLVLGQEAVRGELDGQLTAYVGPQASAAVQSMVQSASRPSDGWLGATVGFAVLLLGASGVFGQLKDALNTVWEVKVKAKSGVLGFVLERLVSFSMVLVIGFLLLTSLLMTTALAALSGYIETRLGVPEFVGALLGFAVSMSVVTLLFAFIFKVLPDARVEWRNVWIGAGVTAFLFELGKFGLSFYLGRESTASSFGAAGSVVLLLLWVYYASCILLFGAEFTRVYARETGHAILPLAGAVPVTAEDRAQQGLVPVAAIEADPPPVITRPASARPLVEVPANFRDVHPLGAMAAAITAGYLVGWLSRRR